MSQSHRSCGFIPGEYHWSETFSLIREQRNRIEVELMRFPIRKTFFNRLGGEY